MNLILTIITAWLACQLVKIIISRKTKAFWQLGGMPSSHAALVGALATAITIQEGYNSTAAVISYVLAAIVIHDALHIRKHHNLTEITAGLIIGLITAVILQAL
ncbi:divergent PAP2 family protein [Candidatus Woesearchaeota archaeon]|nr:divergent PAP2 family protein [Candidatus Woesearchaeota archaeon]MBW3016581.1 divergent PAP2 family protein [Candidatus Woesearchaeota archaeon]